jgi:chromosome segregation ATPase
MSRLLALQPFVAALAAVSIAGVAQAQNAATPPKIVIPKSTPKAPAKAEAKTLGGKGLASGKLLTRDELRQCLKRLDDINAGSKPIETSRTALDAERAELAKAGEALKVEREEIDRKLAAVREWEARVRTHRDAIDAYNKKSATLADAPKDKKEALQAELGAESARLGTAQAALATDEARLVPAYQDAVRVYNVKAEARDAKVGDWNARNSAANEASKKHEDARLSWLDECANRPYREDDEIAIKKEKAQSSK